MADRYELRLPCLRVLQGERALYSFAVDGKRLHDFATVAWVSRGEDAEIAGYQRPEVLKHVKGIQRYLEKPGPLLPNAIVIAFDDRVRFEPTPGATADVAYASAGTLVVPVDETGHAHDKPGWIVDGQQRSAAIRDARIDEFPVCVVSFIADEQEQRAQFILVDNSRPLPKGLIHELLPSTQAELPLQLMRRRLPAEIVNRLNTDADSPFRALIATPTRPDGVVKDTQSSAWSRTASTTARCTDTGTRRPATVTLHPCSGTSRSTGRRSPSRSRARGVCRHAGRASCTEPALRLWGMSWTT